MSKNGRDDFSLKTKEILAKRVCYKCSNPKCQKPTSGPHSDPEKAVNIGVAAHICAAAPGGPRYESSMTNAERSSINNGIWLCQSCSTLIDKDPRTYSIKTLNNWKRKAEQAAELNQASSSFMVSLRKSIKRHKVRIIVSILLVILLLTMIAAIVDKYQNRYSHSEHLQTMNNGYQYDLATQDSILGMNKISPEKASISYNAGIDSYREQQYGTALHFFEEAVDEQEAITGSGSTEVGKIYCMIGLSRIYTQQAVTDGGDDAISAFNLARQIFLQNGDNISLAHCYYFKGIAYFEDETKQFNRSIEEVNNSIGVLRDYLPNGEWSPEKLIDIQNCDECYRLSKCLELFEKDYDLLGRITTMSGNPSSAFYYFNRALEASGIEVNIYHSLYDFLDSNDVDIADEDIMAYLASIEEENTVKIKVYSSDSTSMRVSVDDFNTVSVYENAETATLLTNRAMSELNLLHFENAVEDCQEAIHIWEKLPFSSRTNISYAYNYLAQALIGVASNEPDPQAYLAEKEQELIDYVEAAVQYDNEMYGPEHSRTAYSYEIKGGINYAIGKSEIAIQSYKTALDIYEKLGVDDAAQFCREQIEMIQSNQ